jgi:hypothetical protein
MYNTTYQIRPGFLHVHIAGSESFEAAVSFWKELAHKAQNEGHSAFLIVDEVEGKLDTNDIYELSLKVADLFLGATIAYIDPKEETFDANKFGEVVVRNRGVFATVFHNEAEGVEWLKRECGLAKG